MHDFLVTIVSIDCFANTFLLLLFLSEIESMIKDYTIFPELEAQIDCYGFGKF